MVQYICKICLKEFKEKIDYTRHLNRKYKCKEKNISNSSRAKNRHDRVKNRHKYYRNRK